MHWPDAGSRWLCEALGSRTPGFDALTFFAGLAESLSSIGLLATNPVMQGVRCAAYFRRYDLDGRPLGRIAIQVLQNYAHGTFTDFRGVGRSLSHGLIFSSVEASTKSGAVQGCLS